MPWLDRLQWSRGMNYSNSDFLRRPDEMKILNGCNVDHKIGALQKNLGYSQIGAVIQSGKDITGLFNFRQQDGTEKMLATMNDSGDDDTQLFYYDKTSGAWTEIAQAETNWANEANGTVEMDSLDQYCYFVGHDATDGFKPAQSLTGTTFSNSTNVTNMPEGKFLKRYRDRIYVANTDISGTEHEYRVYFSTVPSGGTITWTVSTNFFDVDYSEQITGLGQNWDRLVIFTRFSAYFHDQTQVKKVFDVGCTNHRTIRNSGAFMLWANRDGVWVSTGGRPLNISGKVIDFIKAGNPDNFFAEVVEEEYHLYIGTVIVDGITYTNTELVFNVAHQTWRIREFKDDLKIFASYVNAGVTELWHGDDSGEVMKHSRYENPTATFTVTIASPAVFTATAHGLVTGDKIKLSTTGALPTGLTPGVTYYVIVAGLTADVFRVSATYQGSAVNTSGSQSGTHTFTGLTTSGDDANDILSHFQTGRFNLDLPSQRLTFNKLMAYSEKAQGLKLYVRIIDKNENVLMDWMKIGECKKFINDFSLRGKKGHFLDIQGRELSQNEFWELNGISIYFRKDTDTK